MMRSRRSRPTPRWLYSGAGLALLPLACTDARSLEAVSTEQGAVIHGVLSDETQDGVVFVDGGTNGLCSGSLIAPNVVLTALHCVAENDKTGVFTCNSDGTLSTSSPPDGSLGALLDPSEVSIRVGVDAPQPPVAHAKKLFGTGALTICQNDIAVIVLDTELELPLVPVRFDRATKAGEFAQVVGYGDNELGTRDGRRVRDDVLVLNVGSDGTSAGSKYAAPRTLVVGEGPCQGDSGGPLRSQETGAAIGVCSVRLGASCTGPGVRTAYTQVAPFESLIRQALDYAGYEPLVEGEMPGAAGAGGEPGVSGDSGAAGEAPAPGAGGSGSGGTAATGAGGASDPGSAGSGDGTGEGGAAAITGTGGGAGKVRRPSGSGSGSGSDHGACSLAAPGSRAPSPSRWFAAAWLAIAFVVRRRSRR
jgi:hypothetical protein